MAENTLLLSSDFAFYTVEGEGRNIGRPSVFLRLSLCNLTCSKFKSPDSPYGCDSYISWSKKNKFTYTELNDFFEKNGFVEKLKRGAILKITGGEPAIWDKKLLEWVQQFKEKFGFYNILGCSTSEFREPDPKLLIDFETNGTIQFSDEWVTIHGATFTTSPKMSNNGDPEHLRYKPETLKWLIKNNACFKFVINNKEDLDELYTKYINDPVIKLPKELVWLMPCCGSRQEHAEKIEMVTELCKEHNFNLSPRLHLVIFDRALKV